MLPVTAETALFDLQHFFKFFFRDQLRSRKLRDLVVQFTALTALISCFADSEPDRSAENLVKLLVLFLHPVLPAFVLLEAALVVRQHGSVQFQ